MNAKILQFPIPAKTTAQLARERLRADFDFKPGSRKDVPNKSKTKSRQDSQEILPEHK